MHFISGAECISRVHTLRPRRRISLGSRVCSERWQRPRRRSPVSARIHQKKYHNIMAAAAAMALAAVAPAVLQRSQRPEQLLVPAARAATLASNECNRPVCHRSTPEMGGLQWFTGFLYHQERPRRSRGALPAAWCNAQRAMGVAHSLCSLIFFCGTLHGTVASLRVPKGRNVMYTCVRNTLISNTRSDTYIWSAPLEALDLTSKSLITHK